MKNAASDLLGHSESQTLEFKAAAVLKNPATVAREVVAFPNSDGGTIWIGLDEKDGKAASLEPIPNADKERDALWNHLTDTIEPPPHNEEVEIEVADGSVIRIVVKPGRRRPYATLKNQARNFVLRIGNRVRSMTREEVAQAFRETQPKEIDAEKQVREAIDKASASKKREMRFWLIPDPPATIDFERASDEDKSFITELLTNPRASNNRRHGWTMVSPQDRPDHRTERVIQTVGSGDNQRGVEISRTGALTFWVPTEHLFGHWTAEDLERIFPFALLELPVSAFRIAARLYTHFALGGRVFCGAIISGISGRKLRPGSPDVPQPPWKQTKTFEGDALTVRPFEMETDKLRAQPDGEAYRLILRIYEAFDLGADDIPSEFDSRDHVLRLRE